MSEALAFACARCHRTFSWSPKQATDAEPTYCGPTCRRAARRGRSSAGPSAPSLPPRFPGRGACPTPQKVAYTGRDGANRGAYETDPRDHELRAYWCSCGFWHNGHSRNRSPR